MIRVIASRFEPEAVAVLALAAGVWLLLKILRIKRDKLRTRKLEDLAVTLGLCWEGGTHRYDALHAFDIADNEYSVNITDRLYGQLEGLDIAVFDFLHHRSPHSGNPPYRETVFHCLSEAVEIESAVAAAARAGLNAESAPGRGFILYRPGVSVRVEQIQAFIQEALTVLKA